MDWQGFVTALSNLGDKGADALIAWAWLRFGANCITAFTVITVFSLVTRTIFLLSRHWQVLAACSKCGDHNSNNSDVRFRHNRAEHPENIG
jgi:hypothetical protein